MLMQLLQEHVQSKSVTRYARRKMLDTLAELYVAQEISQGKAILSALKR